MDVNSFLAGIVVGIIGLIFVMAVIVPDRWSVPSAKWMATLKNVPTMLLPFALVALAFGLYLLGSALVIALSHVGNMWPSLAYVGGGLVFVLLFVFMRRKANATEEADEPAPATPAPADATPAPAEPATPAPATTAPAVTPTPGITAFAPTPAATPAKAGKSRSKKRS